MEKYKEINVKRLIARLGLPDDSSWNEIDEALGLNIPSYEEYLEKQGHAPNNR